MQTGKGSHKYSVQEKDQKQPSGYSSVYLWDDGDHFVALKRVTGLEREDFIVTQYDFGYECKRGIRTIFVTEIDEDYDPIPTRKKTEFRELKAPTFS